MKLVVKFKFTKSKSIQTLNTYYDKEIVALYIFKSG